MLLPQRNFYIQAITRLPSRRLNASRLLASRGVSPHFRQLSSFTDFVVYKVSAREFSKPPCYVQTITLTEAAQGSFVPCLRVSSLARALFRKPVKICKTQLIFLARQRYALKPKKPFNFRISSQTAHKINVKDGNLTKNLCPRAYTLTIRKPGLIAGGYNDYGYNKQF